MQSQRNSFIYSILEFPYLYSKFQSLVGGNIREWLFEKHWNLSNFNGKIIEVGCGPADSLQFLPFAKYVGFDINPSYIDKAKKKWSDRGTFLNGTLKQLENNPELKNADIILFVGVLHHLGDEETDQVLSFAKNILSKDGKVLGIEPAFSKKQSLISKLIVSLDRGVNVRDYDNWKILFQKYFPNIESNLHHNLLRIPYTHILFQAQL